MKVGVCLKVVPASDTAIKVAGADAGIDESAVSAWVINPYDEFALEEAVQMKEAGKASDVTVFTIGSKAHEKQMREALAKGADAAVRLEDGAFDGSDSLGVARILAEAAKAEGVQMLFFGKQAIDGDNAQVPSMVAELLDWPQVLVVDKLEVDGGSAKAWRDAGGGAREIVQTSLPAVISTDKGINEPRYSNLRAIMMAKKKKIAVKGAGDLGLDAGQVGAAGAKVKTTGWSLPPARPPGRMLDGDVDSQVSQLVSLLRDEAKVI